MLAVCTYEDPVSMVPLATKRMALVVEDEMIIAGYLASLLEELGFNVAIATTVKCAMQLVHERKFEVAFVDLGLPDRSGLELISDLSRQFQELPIVIASGYGDMAHRDMAESRRMFNVLNKPYQKLTLVRLLKQMGFSLPH